MSDKQKSYSNIGNAGLNLEMIPTHLRQWDILGEKREINQTIENNKICGVVNIDETIVKDGNNKLPSNNNL